MSKITKIGLPSGGTTGQVLKKKTGTNYDVEWGTGGGGGSGTVTSVATTAPITGGTITTTGTIGITQATTSTDGYLSSTDWNTFNGKQNALTNPVTGTGTNNEIAYFTGASTIGSLTTGTYPSLTELSYVKGVTSAIQTQLNGKQATLTNPVTGTGTTNYLPKFTGASTIGNSTIQDLTTGVLVSPSVTAASNIARGLYHTPSLTAAANNDVLVGLDINPTFTNGAFTGVSNWAIRTGTSGEVLFQGGNGVYVTGNNSGIWGNTTRTRGLYFNSSGDIIVRTNNIDNRLVASNGGNTLIGTGTDSGFKLDVNGTARISNYLYVSGGNGSGLSSATLNTSLFLWNRRTSTSGDGISIDDFNEVNGTNVNINNLNFISSITVKIGGTSTLNIIAISKTYDLAVTTTSSSIIRGFYYNPTITNLRVAQHRAIETVTGDIYFASTSGSVGIGVLPSATYKLDVNGTARIQDNLTISDAKNIILDTTTGTKIGTATTQKIGFFNATPVVQPSAVTTAQGIADALSSLGLLASSTVAGGESVGSKLYLFNSY